MSVKDLREALDGPQGAMDGYLELADEAEIKADIRALIYAAQPSQEQIHAMVLQQQRDRRERIAAMAMQGLCANQHHADRDHQYTAAEAVHVADLLIAELEKQK